MVIASRVARFVAASSSSRQPLERLRQRPQFIKLSIQDGRCRESRVSVTAGSRYGVGRGEQTPRSTGRFGRPDREDHLDSGRGIGIAHLGPHAAALDETRYVVASELGKGGQGTVWKAHDRVLRREVAVKRLHPELMKEPALVANFLREARLTASLQHAGIVPLHDVGLTADGVAAIVLRRVEGRSLAELLTDRKTLEERLTLVPALLRACQARRVCARAARGAPRPEAAEHHARRAG